MSEETTTTTNRGSRLTNKESVILWKENYQNGWESVVEAYRAATGSEAKFDGIKQSFGNRISTIRKGIQQHPHNLSEEEANEKIPRMARKQSMKENLDEVVEFLTGGSDSEDKE